MKPNSPTYLSLPERLTLLLAAITLLSYGLFSWANHHWIPQKVNHPQAIAITLALEKLQDLRHSSSPITHNVGGSLPAGTLMHHGIEFTRSWRVEDTPATHTKEVTIFLTWQDPQLGSQNYTLHRRLPPPASTPLKYSTFWQSSL
ncbi:MAG: hypothetical protein G8345_13800 [Magnetococcales bacterium]|nr:hypothetical protein [Magnetococcales bacterium]NGZ27949.1 hypothetical protein [Magnetococcales bacterium]